MGETVRLTATLHNSTDALLPSPIALIGIPAGLSPQSWQLKELQEKEIFDYYELIDGYAVFYFEHINAGNSRTVALDLKADIPGEYETPASSAYLYYTNEHKVWAMPETLVVE